MNAGRVVELLRLQAAVAFARLGAAGRRRLGLPDVVAGAAATLITGALLLAAAIAFAAVGSTLLGALAGSSRLALARSAGAAVAECAVILTLVTVLLSDTQRSGLRREPLAVLPVGRSAVIGHELISLLFLSPTAFVVWPASLALLLGAAQHSGAAGLLTVPAASGVAVLASSLALLVRRLSTASTPGGAPALARPLPRALALGACVGWILLALAPLREGAFDGVFPGAPGHWVSEALGAAFAHEARAIVIGLALHLLGFGLVSLAFTLPEGPRRAATARPGLGLPADAVRIWSLPRARSLMVQGLVTAALTFVLAAALELRGMRTLPLAALTLVLVVWLIALAPTALAANALGLGGLAAAGDALLPSRAMRRLAGTEAWIAAPAALAIGLAAPAIGLFFDRPDLGVVGACAGAGLLLAGCGCGALVSVLWPHRARLRDDGDPVWASGMARLVMPAAQGLVLAPILVEILTDPTALTVRAASASLLVGLSIAVLGIWLASRRLERRAALVAEALLE